MTLLSVIFSHTYWAAVGPFAKQETGLSKDIQLFR